MLTAREDGQWSDAFCWEKPRNHGCRAGRRLAPACARRASPPLLAAPKPARVAPLYSGANTAPNTPRNNAFCAPSLPRKSESSTRLCGNPRGERPRNAELTAGSSSEAVNATLSAPQNADSLQHALASTPRMPNGRERLLDSSSIFRNRSLPRSRTPLLTPYGLEGPWRTHQTS